MTQNTKLDFQKLLRMIEESVNTEKKDNDRVVSYLQECDQLGVEVLLVDINQSDVKCTIDEQKKHLRLGFSAIVPGNEQFIEDIVDERQKNGQFQNFQNFCERIPIETVPFSFFTHCVEAGAFDAVEISRSSLFTGYERIIQAVQKSASEHSANQISLFDILPASLSQLSPIPLPETEAWTEKETIEHEKAALGFSFTEYLLHRDRDEENEEESEVETTDIVASESALHRDEKNEEEPQIETNVQAESQASEIVVAEPEEQTEALEPEVVAEPEEQLQAPEPESFPPLPPEQFLSEEFEVSFPQEFEQEPPPLDQKSEVSATSPSALKLQFASDTATETALLQLKNLCERHSGKTPVQLEFSDETGNKTLMNVHDDYWVTISEELLQAIKMIVGEDKIVLLPVK